MSKKSRFRGPFEELHGKRSQTLLKFAPQTLYLTHLPLVSQLSWKKSLLLTCKILGLLLNRYAADEKYQVLNREILMIPIQMQLYETQKNFSEFLTAFVKSRLNLKNFEKKI